MTATTTPQSGAELLARIRPVLATKSTQICLRPDLIAEWETADKALSEAKVQERVAEGRMADRKGESADVKRLAKKVKALEDEIEAHAITFTFQAMPKDRWRELTEQHPPRSGNNIDHVVGYNRDAAADAAVRASLIDPVFDEASWGQFLAVCNPSEWGELRETANVVNGAVTDLPKSHLASQVLAKPGTASRPRNSGT
jgi:hypothetical protein